MGGAQESTAQADTSPKFSRGWILGLRPSDPAVFVLSFVFIFALHIPLLRLPYFWDEAGYYIPAARDLLLTGSLIPHSTPSNAHPPLVMAYLALWWKLLGYTPVVTRTAMVIVAAFSLTGLFRMAAAVASVPVAWACVLCTALYPVFFAQSSLAHLDLAAAGLTWWALAAYVRRQHGAMALWFSLAALAKETAVIAPVALLLWGLVCHRLRGKEREEDLCVWPRSASQILLLIPLLPLTAWYLYHYLHTGLVFGNPEFFRYNVLATLNPLRILLAFGLRVWQLTVYLGLYLLTAAGILAMWKRPVYDETGERRRIPVGAQLAWLVVILAYAGAMATVGGAELARYMLPVVPLVMVIWISTLRRRLRQWVAVLAIVLAGFVLALFVNPPYGFAPEDNLAYRDYVRLHEQAEHYLEARYPMARVLTAWPASDELRHPYLGYVTRPMRVLRIENFSLDQVIAAQDLRSRFDVALVFSTKYQPAHSVLANWQLWREWKTRFFGYHRDVPAAAVAQILGGQLVYSDERRGQWIGVIEMQQVFNARLSTGYPASR